MHIPDLRDGAVELRPIAVSDTDRIYELLSDSPEISRWTRIPWPYERVHAEEFVGRQRELEAAGTDAALAITEGGALLGCIGLHRLGADMQPRAASQPNEVGYWLHRDARGRGLATRSLILLADWALDVLRCEVVRLQVMDGNDESRRVAERAGFSYMGAVEPAELDTTDDPCSQHRLHRYERRATTSAEPHRTDPLPGGSDRTRYR